MTKEEIVEYLKQNLSVCVSVYKERNGYGRDCTETKFVEVDLYLEGLKINTDRDIIED